MKRLFVVAALLMMGCSAEMIDDSPAIADGSSTIEVINHGAAPVAIAVSASSTCDPVAKAGLGRELGRDQAQVAEIAADTATRVVIAEGSFLCAGSNAVGYPVQPGAIYNVTNGIIVDQGPR